MKESRFSSEPWWNSVTAAEREEILREIEEDELKEEEIKEVSEGPAKFKAIDLFGWG